MTKSSQEKDQLSQVNLISKRRGGKNSSFLPFSSNTQSIKRINPREVLTFCMISLSQPARVRSTLFSISNFFFLFFSSRFPFFLLPLTPWKRLRMISVELR